jgi:hypothetical protein
MDLDINVIQTITIAESVTRTFFILYYVDYVNGASGNSGLSWALAKKRIDDIASYSGVCEIMVAKTPDPISIGSVTWTDNGAVLTLAVAKTKVIDMFG